MGGRTHSHDASRLDVGLVADLFAALNVTASVGADEISALEEYGWCARSAFPHYSDFLYYTITTVSTVGYGDWSPFDYPTRAVAVFMMLTLMLWLPYATARSRIEWPWPWPWPRRRHGWPPRTGPAAPMLEDESGACSAGLATTSTSVRPLGHPPRRYQVTSLVEMYVMPSYSIGKLPSPWHDFVCLFGPAPRRCSKVAASWRPPPTAMPGGVRAPPSFATSSDHHHLNIQVSPSQLAMFVHEFLLLRSSAEANTHIVLLSPLPLEDYRLVVEAAPAGHPLRTRLHGSMVRVAVVAVVPQLASAASECSWMPPRGRVPSDRGQAAQS